VLPFPFKCIQIGYIPTNNQLRVGTDPKYTNGRLNQDAPD